MPASDTAAAVADAADAAENRFAELTAGPCLSSSEKSSVVASPSRC